VATCDKVAIVVLLAFLRWWLRDPAATRMPHTLPFDAFSFRLQDLKRRIRKIPGVPIMCPPPSNRRGTRQNSPATALIRMARQVH
jgi:hypothetical protein